MISTDQIQTLLESGGTVVGEDGSKIGKVGQVYLDDETGAPEWVTVKTGMFGGAESFVPLAQGSVSGDQIRVPYGKDKVKNAPRIDESGHLSQDQEAQLYRYYDLSYSQGTSDSGLPTSGGTGPAREQTGGVGHDTSGPTTDEAMTRSEEQLRVGTAKTQAGKAKLRKFVVSEQVSTTVPVSHEEARVTREPITDANRAAAESGPQITEAVQEVTLTEEQPVVSKQAVPVERVRLEKETVTEQAQVTEDVRKERIDTEGPQQNLPKKH